MMECVVTNLADEYPKLLRKNKEIFILVVCLLCYIVALPMVFQVCDFRNKFSNIVCQTLFVKHLKFACQAKRLTV